jgi:hypothetical protein
LEVIGGVFAAGVTGLMLWAFRRGSQASPVIVTATPETQATLEPAIPTQSPTPEIIPEADPLADGKLIGFDGTTLIVGGPLSQKAFLVAESFHAFDFGTPTILGAGSLGRNIALTGDVNGIVRADLLPEFLRMTGGETLDAQVEPTGETTQLGTLTMVTRAGWGAAPPNHDAPNENGVYNSQDNPYGWLVYDQPLNGLLTTLVIHHTAMDYDLGPREIQILHMVTKGWADIGYHFVIDGFGQLYAGRDLGARGTHTGRANTGTLGVSLLGNFNLTTPPRAQLNTLTTLAAYLVQQYGIGYLAGHRDFQPGVTECPGDTLEGLIDDLAISLNLKFGTEGYVPPPT